MVNEQNFKWDSFIQLAMILATLTGMVMVASAMFFDAGSSKYPTAVEIMGLAKDETNQDRFNSLIGIMENLENQEKVYFSRAEALRRSVYGLGTLSLLAWIVGALGGNVRAHLKAKKQAKKTPRVGKNP